MTDRNGSNGIMAAPQPLTMDRLGERNEVVLAQSTSQCCRCLCCQPSINWLVAEGNNFQPGSDPYDLDAVGWIHEESTLEGRCLSCFAPGCRGITYVQHSGPPPESMTGENKDWCACQREETTAGLSEEDRRSNVVATHEKHRTCGVYCCSCILPGIPFCLCNGCGLPYLETKDPKTGDVLGKTQYVCDLCCFVPKYDVFDASGEQLYRLRPDTCVGGLCVQCRCDGGKGKCCRVPYLLRHPETHEPIASGAAAETPAGDAIQAMVDVLWTGWKSECCTTKNAYHVAFPANATAQEKAVVMGSALLADVTMFEQNDDS